MTEAEWLTSADPAAMLAWVSSQPADRATKWTNAPVHYVATDRKLRLFACACCRAVWDGVPCPNPKCVQGGVRGRYGYGRCETCGGTGRTGGLTGPRSRQAVEIAERFADGEALADEFRPLGEALPYPISASLRGVYDTRLIKQCGIPYAVQAALLRCLFGNPWRPVPGLHGAKYQGGVWHETAGWLTPAVLAVASAVYDDRRWSDLPVLADALEEAGCQQAAILKHCRGKGPHARGCWAVDLILGKE